VPPLIHTLLEREVILVRELKNGNVSAFDELFEIYGKRIHHFAFGYLKSQDDADEIVQDVFFRIWEKRKELKPELSFKAYLFKISYNYILQYFEKARKSQAYKDRIIEESLTFDPDLDERIDYQALLDQLETIIDSLPPRQKDIFVRRRKEGQSVKDIAKALGLSPKTIENHLTQAIREVKRQMGNSNLSTVLFYVLFVGDL